MADAGAEGRPPRYSAFISYNHRDRKVAAWLQHSLETYRVPKRMQGRDSPFGPLGPRLPPIFRDRDELAASADLAQSVRTALEASHSLIVLCSPSAAGSKWVNEEIRSFIVLGRAERIQCLIVEGTPHASTTPGADPEQECFPPALFERGAGQPLAADLRKDQDGPQAAKLKLLAGILGVGYDELRQREQARRARRLTVAAGVLGTAFLFMTGLAAFALVSRNEAVRQRDIARQKTMTAERTVDFVKSLFEVSDPSEARGATITAREILDRGAAQIQTGLAGEPSVKAELSTTLGEVYGGLGLFHQGEALIRQALPLKNVDPATRARQFAALGEAQARQGDYAGAAGSYRAALDVAKAADPNPALTSRTLVGLGEARSALNDDAGSNIVLSQALKLDLQRLGPGQPDVARDLEALADNDIGARRYQDARGRLEQALAIRLRTQGQMLPKVAENLNGLGAIAYFLHQPVEAERYYRRAMAVALVVFGPNHPDTATIMGNIGRLMVERRAFAEAEPLLRRAVTVILQQRDASFDDLAFSFDNLGLAKRGLGDDAAAQDLYLKALKAARVHNHRNVAPVLVDLADVYCGHNRQREAMAMLDEAAPIMARAYADDPWRSAWLETIRGRCLLAAGDRPGALAALTRSVPVIQARWRRDTLYGARAAELLAAARGHD